MSRYLAKFRNTGETEFRTDCAFDDFNTAKTYVDIVCNTLIDRAEDGT